MYKQAYFFYKKINGRMEDRKNGRQKEKME
jgi:hypothetical protein